MKLKELEVVFFTEYIDTNNEYTLTEIKCDSYKNLYNIDSIFTVLNTKKFTGKRKDYNDKSKKYELIDFEIIPITKITFLNGEELTVKTIDEFIIKE